MATVILKKQRAKPFFRRHPWVFSGAVDKIEGEFQNGDVVNVTDTEGKFIGKGYINSSSQIVVRLLSWDIDEEINDNFFRSKLLKAVALRENVLGLLQTDAYRLVFSDADGLPGLIVDKYTDYLVVQFLTLGMAVRRELILNLLDELCSPIGIYEKSDSSVARKEGIPRSNGILRGDVPEAILIQENGITFAVDIPGGQKTGFYLDQRDNRKLVASFCEDRRVLDCFTYTGGFAIHAAVRGKAKEVIAIEVSSKSVKLAQKNAELNGAEKIEFRTADVFQELRRLKTERERFDVVILDPPKFAHTRVGAKRAHQGYRDINLLAMQLLNPDGILVTCSCSQHISIEVFGRILNGASIDAHRNLQVLEMRSQSSDHPVISSCPEMNYLKCYICRVS